MEDVTMELYGGIYKVGIDIPAGNYEMTHLGESCDVYIYQSEDAFEAGEKEWDFLYGKDDKELYSLQDGMIVQFSSGGVLATKK